MLGVPSLCHSNFRLHYIMKIKDMQTCELGELKSNI